MNFREACGRFQNTCERLREFGANDGETQAALFNVLRKNLQGEQVELPTGREEWHLYDVTGADTISKTLTEDARPLLEMVRQAAEIVKTVGV